MAPDEGRKKINIYGIKVLSNYVLLKMACNSYGQFSQDINELVHFVDMHLFDVEFAFGKLVFDF